MASLAKPHKEVSHNIGPWLLTYADMVTLMLGCFVMLASMSEPVKKEDKRYQQAIESIQRALGLPGGFGRTTSNLPPDAAAQQILQVVAKHQDELARSATTEEGVPGHDAAVKSLRDNGIYRVGGAIHFAQGSAKLPDEGVPDLRQIVNQIRGLTMTVQVRGHSSKVPLPKDSPFHDDIDLSMARARAVRDWLADPTRGNIDAQRLRIMACGSTEPLREPAYDPSDWSLNDRVEIVLTEALVSDFEAAAAPISSAKNEEKTAMR